MRSLELPRTPPDLVLRPRLFDLLDAGAADRALTLLSAPPGAGKTVLLSSWLGERPPDGLVAWATLREADRAPFWRQVLDAFRRSAPGDTQLHRLDPPVDDASPEFIEDFVDAVAALDERLVLVVDDLHLASPAALGALDRVLRAPPLRFRLVAASRLDPHLGLHVLRVTGDLAEIRARELAFDETEARELFAGMGVDLDERHLAAVVRRTEGWAAGLRLLGLSLQARPGDVGAVERFDVDERPVADYLAQEVLSAQPPDIRLFLLRISIVDTVDGELANELSGRSDGERVLERLLRDNVFVERVPGRGRVYRFQQLFGALLRAEAASELNSELGRLHERAAVYLARKGRPAEAVRHSVDAQRWKLVATLVAEHWSAVFASGDEGALGHAVLDDLPAKNTAAFPIVAAFKALTRIASGDGRGATALLAEAAARRDDVPPAAGLGLDALIRYASALAARARGDFGQAASLATLGLERAAVEVGSAETEDQRRALNLATLGAAQVWTGPAEEAQSTLEEALDLARRSGTSAAEIDALTQFAVLELRAGHLRRADRIARAALQLERAGRYGAPSGTIAHVVVALVQHEWGDLDAANAALRAAGGASPRGGDVPSRILAALAASTIALSEDGDDADEALLHLRGVRRRTPSLDGAFGHRLRALEARLLAKTARLEEAADVLGDPRTSPDEAVAAARIALAVGSPTDALDALAQRRDAAPYVEIEALVTEAIAHRTLGTEDAAVTAIGAALTLAEPEAVRRPFMDAGGAVRELLGAHLRRTNMHRWLATELVALLDGRNAAEDVAPAELLHSLSDREREVLHYLPTIMSNADIAAELFVSVNTVKTHVKSIYRKLGATRRRDAVRRARQLRLL